MDRIKYKPRAAAKPPIKNESVIGMSLGEFIAAALFDSGVREQKKDHLIEQFDISEEEAQIICELIDYWAGEE